MEYKNEDDFFAGKKNTKNLILADEKDRPYLISKIKEKEQGELFFMEEDHLFFDVMNEIFQTSLFSPNKIFVILHSDHYTDKNWETLFKEQEAVIYCIRKGAKKSLSQRFSKDGAILSLLEEKPWERKNRLVSKVVYSMHKSGITISQSVAFRFVERVHTDLHLFDGELSKLKIYAMDKKSIEERDVDALVKPLEEENAFKVAEEVIWKGKNVSNFTVDTVSILLQVIGAFRFQAYLGLKLLANEEVNMPYWQVKKYKPKVDALGAHFFKQILLLLFQIEQRAKQTSMSPSALYDLLVIDVLSHFLVKK